MSDTIQLGDIEIELTRKAVKHAHLSVHPPLGRVSLVAPAGTRLEVARAFAITKLAWIREQRARLLTQVREAPRRFVQRETHHLWGRRHLLAINVADAKPRVLVDHRRITLTIRPDTSATKRAEIMHDWHKSLLHGVVPKLLQEWSRRLGVPVPAYFLQRMKTKWGSCNHRARHIRLNTELVKKPRDLLEYVVVHEMLHLIEPNHSQRFVDLLTQHYPTWREARAELNELALSAEVWRE